MNPFDNHLPPTLYFSETPDQHFAIPPPRRILVERHLATHRRMKRKPAHDRDMSSSSDDDNMAGSSPKGACFTPQNETPPDDKAATGEAETLVVVPEEEIGMTADKKHLYSKFILGRAHDNH